MRCVVDRVCVVVSCAKLFVDVELGIPGDGGIAVLTRVPYRPWLLVQTVEDASISLRVR